MGASSESCYYQERAQDLIREFKTEDDDAASQYLPFWRCRRAGQRGLQIHRSPDATNSSSKAWERLLCTEGKHPSLAAPQKAEAELPYYHATQTCVQSPVHKGRWVPVGSMVNAERGRYEAKESLCIEVSILASSRQPERCEARHRKANERFWI